MNIFPTVRRLAATLGGWSAAWLAFAGPLLGAEPRDAAAYIPQELRGQLPGVGMFLVASHGLADPNFHHTVILLARHDSDGSLGVVINRPSRLLVGDVVPGAGGGRASRIFIGGPVQPVVLSLLARRESIPSAMDPVMGNIYFLLGTARVAHHLTHAPPDNAVRVYAGYAGWAPGQLDSEIRRGAWHVIEGSSAGVFDIDPALLWEHLMSRIRGRWI